MNIDFKNLIFLFLFIFTSNLNARKIGVYFENNEKFNLKIVFGDINVKIKSNEKRTILIDSNSIFKIFAEKGSMVEFDLDRVPKENTYLVISLDKEILKIMDQDFSYINLKPFRP
ncbi:hypothetical protein GF385_01350 [Candidatus Dependentiae bacterium]|nr:hypothetical protein [Candidatus Dependentiae bacterium]